MFKHCFIFYKTKYGKLLNTNLIMCKIVGQVQICKISVYKQTFWCTTFTQYNMFLCGCAFECTTFAPATIAPVVNPNVKHNPNPNPNPNPNLNLTLPRTKNPNTNLTLNSLLSEISSQKQMSDHCAFSCISLWFIYHCLCLADLSLHHPQRLIYICWWGRRSKRPRLCSSPGIRG